MIATDRRRRAGTLAVLITCHSFSPCIHLCTNVIQSIPSGRRLFLGDQSVEKVQAGLFGRTERRQDESDHTIRASRDGNGGADDKDVRYV